MSYPAQVIYDTDMEVKKARNLQEKASRLYRKATAHTTFKRIWARITGRRDSLMALDELSRQGELHPEAYAGVKTVDIAAICGSENRAKDFDREFNPTYKHNRERWIRVAQAWLKKEDLPPVELIEVDGRYFVRDGHHRISVAHTAGQRYIEADIIKFHFRPAL